MLDVSNFDLKFVAFKIAYQDAFKLREINYITIQPQLYGFGSG